jgi:hypothetical protein
MKAPLVSSAAAIVILFAACARAEEGAKAAPAPDAGPTDASSTALVYRCSAAGALGYALIEQGLNGRTEQDLFTAWSLLMREAEPKEAAEALLDAAGAGEPSLAGLAMLLATQRKAGAAAFTEGMSELLGPAEEKRAYVLWTKTEPPEEEDLGVLSAGGRLAVRVLRSGLRPTLAEDRDIEREALRALVAEPHADRAFKFLVGEGQPVTARAAGLCGLWRTQPAAYDAVLDAVLRLAEDTPPATGPVAWTRWTGKHPPESEADLSLTRAGRLALADLARAKRFLGPMIGEGGEPPSHAQALRVLVRDPGADAAFKLLAESDAAAPRVYAACGLWFTDRAYVERIATRLESEGEKVPTMFGCMLADEDAAAVAKALREGEYAKRFFFAD